MTPISFCSPASAPQPPPSPPGDSNLLRQPGQWDPKDPRYPRLLPQPHQGTPAAPPSAPGNTNLLPQPGAGSPAASPSPTRQAAEEERVRVPQVAVLQQHQGAGPPLSPGSHHCQEPPQTDRGRRHLDHRRQASPEAGGRTQPISARSCSRAFQSSTDTSSPPANHRDAVVTNPPPPRRAATVAPLRGGRWGSAGSQ